MKKPQEYDWNNVKINFSPETQVTNVDGKMLFTVEDAATDEENTSTEFVLCIHNNIQNIDKSQMRAQIYITPWNNFASYGDFENTNNTYQLAFVVYKKDMLVNGSFVENFSYDNYEFWSQCLHKVVDYFLKDCNEDWKLLCNDVYQRDTIMRVSHIVWTHKPLTALTPPVYEYVVRRAKKPQEIQ